MEGVWSSSENASCIEARERNAPDAIESMRRRLGRRFRLRFT
jgi:hypothetical protein